VTFPPPGSFDRAAYALAMRLRVRTPPAQDDRLVLSPKRDRSQKSGP
jgi:hypothetical protein